MKKDNVNHPKHYTSHPSGVECISITAQLTFCLGNVVKYLWRAPLKHGAEDVRKAQWYMAQEIDRLGPRVEVPRAATNLLRIVAEVEERGFVAGVFRAIASGNLARAQEYLEREVLRHAS